MTSIRSKSAFFFLAAQLAGQLSGQGRAFALATPRESALANARCSFRVESLHKGEGAAARSLTLFGGDVHLMMNDPPAAERAVALIEQYPLRAVPAYPSSLPSLVRLAERRYEGFERFLLGALDLFGGPTVLDLALVSETADKRPPQVFGYFVDKKGVLGRLDEVAQNMFNAMRSWTEKVNEVFEKNPDADSLLVLVSDSVVSNSLAVDKFDRIFAHLVIDHGFERDVISDPTSCKALSN